jgi:hypothetical protein
MGRITTRQVRAAPRIARGGVIVALRIGQTMKVGTSTITRLPNAKNGDVQVAVDGSDAVEFGKKA